jgi:hypothetical protein
MPFLPAFFLMSQTAQTGQVEVMLHYRRPSAVLANVKAVGATLVAHDDRGAVGIAGTPQQIETARSFLKLLDVPRKPLLIRVTVTSPADHLTWEVDARLTSGQRWKTSDEETGSEIALEPRLADDGTLNVKVLARCRGIELTSTLRLPKGGSRSMALGKKIVQDIQVGPGDRVTSSEGGVPLPIVTVRYVGG